MSLDKLKIRVGEPIQKLKITPEKLGLKAKNSKHREEKSENGICREPLKVRIVTPKSKKLLTFYKTKDVLVNSVNSFHQSSSLSDPYALDLNPSNAIIRKSAKKLTKSTKKSTKSNKHSSKIHKSQTNPTDAISDKTTEESRRKYSIFKSRNSGTVATSSPRVQFTDQTIGKNLCIRSNPSLQTNSTNESAMHNHDGPLNDSMKSEFDDSTKFEDSDDSAELEDEFLAEQGALVSPSKLQVLASPSQVSNMGLIALTKHN